MKFLSLLAALLIEQARPLRAGNPVYTGFERYAAMLERHLHAGAHHHGLIAWILAVGPWASFGRRFTAAQGVLISTTGISISVALVGSAHGYAEPLGAMKTRSENEINQKLDGIEGSTG